MLTEQYEHLTFVLEGMWSCIEEFMNYTFSFSTCFLKKLSQISWAHFLIMFFLLYTTRELSDDLGQPVNCISMSNDGNCILASCLDSTLRLLDR